MAAQFSFKVGGPAGFGIKSTGLAFAKLATRSGYWAYSYVEYPSIIRGGHNMMQVVVDEEQVTAPIMSVDLLMALNQETIDLHASEMREGGLVIFDAEKGLHLDHCPDGVKGVEVPLKELTKEAGGSEIMRNTTAMGATLALLGGDLEVLKEILKDEFGRKGEEVVHTNQAVAQAGFDYVMEHYKELVRAVLQRREVKEKLMMIEANEAVARGAIAAGLEFVAIYPMTPTTNILHNLAPFQKEFGFVYKQPEDEMAAINMAIGASFAGARSMVASAGGGFCLMAEGYGLAGITETPVVMIVGMRGGPATGLPTWTEQGDLRFVLHAHQGDFTRIVLAAGDAEEAFHLSMEAFNLADRYQTPVVVLVDKMICESPQSYPAFRYDEYEVDRGRITWEKEENYERYGLSDDGISLRSVPGVGNHMVANSDEHNTVGFSSEEADNRVAQMNKRMKKLVTCAEQDMRGPVVYGPEEAAVTVVSWGSNKGAILLAMKFLKKEGIEINFIHTVWMNPFPADELKVLLSKANYLLGVECNYSAQFAGLVKERTGIEILDTLLKYDGRPIYPEEIVGKVKEIVSTF